MSIAVSSAAEQAGSIRDQLPPGGLFAGHDWRISPFPFRLDAATLREFETLGRVLLQFNRACNLLYRQSHAGEQPGWIAEWLDRGKPGALIDLQRSPAFKSDLPRVIRPDLLLTESGLAITELDSVPGGIGLTAWLNQAYSRAPASAGSAIVGGSEGMLRGFAGIFGDARHVHLLVSDESATYRPEMEWICQQPGFENYSVDAPGSARVRPGDAVYRFFELFDAPSVEASTAIFELAQGKQVFVTPPPKMILEEKMLFALLWNRNLQSFWRRNLGQSFLDRLLRLIPYTWLLDPAPLPPQGAFPELNLTDWHQLKELSQRERELILKVSGFSEEAWGARGVYLGSDLSVADWSAAVERALAGAEQSPYVLQRYHKPRVVEASWFDFVRGELRPMPARVRLCPYYFVVGQGDAARAELGGVLATLCPADKKIIHGMREAILAPCST